MTLRLYLGVFIFPIFCGVGAFHVLEYLFAQFKLNGLIFDVLKYVVALFATGYWFSLMAGMEAGTMLFPQLVFGVILSAIVSFGAFKAVSAVLGYYHLPSQSVAILIAIICFLVAVAPFFGDYLAYRDYYKQS